MSSGTIEIADRDGFPAKTAAITTAAENLRALAAELDGILASARTEASSFTAGGVAPIYDETLKGLAAWCTAAKSASEAVAASADSCAAALTAKFTRITAADDRGAAAITRT